MTPPPKLGLRWTIGDVSAEGFEALRLSISGAWKLFGPHADYAICVNSLAITIAQENTGDLPCNVTWHQVSRADMPGSLLRHLDSGMAEGAAWKLVPLRLFPDQFELSLDNDCILWSLPGAMGAWLNSTDASTCLAAEDVTSLFGRHAFLCGSEPRNLGLRGLPPRFDLAAALEIILERRPGKLASELDEQGLQLAAISILAKPLAVSLEDVTICSPFPPHLPYLGTCGAHFVGLNARQLPWSLNGRTASDLTREHWRRLKPEVERRTTPVQIMKCA